MRTMCIFLGMYCTSCTRVNIYHWKQRVVMMSTLWSLAASEVVIPITLVPPMMTKLALWQLSGLQWPVKAATGQLICKHWSKGRSELGSIFYLMPSYAAQQVAQALINIEPLWDWVMRIFHVTLTQDVSEGPFDKHISFLISIRKTHFAVILFLGPLFLTWLHFNPSMDKLLDPL